MNGFRQKTGRDRVFGRIDRPVGEDATIHIRDGTEGGGPTSEERQHLYHRDGWRDDHHRQRTVCRRRRRPGRVGLHGRVWFRGGRACAAKGDTPDRGALLCRSIRHRRPQGDQNGHSLLRCPPQIRQSPHLMIMINDNWLWTRQHYSATWVQAWKD